MDTLFLLSEVIDYMHKSGEWLPQRFSSAAEQNKSAEGRAGRGRGLGTLCIAPASSLQG